MKTRSPMEVLQEAVDGVQRLSRLLRKGKTPQVKSKEEQQIIKATALAWFNNHCLQLDTADTQFLKAVELEYSQLFACAARASLRTKYQGILRRLKDALIALQSQQLSNPPPRINTTAPERPDFSPLVPGSRMQKILENRWEEIVKCLQCNAPLAATIMMGGLLEALFLARVNKLTDKAVVFRARAAPKEAKTKKPLPLDRWMLNSYIEVGAELGWIRRPAKDIGIILRDYRNFVHPERELSTGFTIEKDDAELFWQILSKVSQQIISNAGK